MPDNAMRSNKRAPCDRAGGYAYVEPPARDHATRWVRVPGARARDLAGGSGAGQWDATRGHGAHRGAGRFGHDARAGGRHRTELAGALAARGDELERVGRGEAIAAGIDGDRGADLDERDVVPLLVRAMEDDGQDGGVRTGHLPGAGAVAAIGVGLVVGAVGMEDGDGWRIGGIAGLRLQ